MVFTTLYFSFIIVKKILILFYWHTSHEKCKKRRKQHLPLDKNLTYRLNNNHLTLKIQIATIFQTHPPKNTVKVFNHTNTIFDNYSSCNSKYTKTIKINSKYLVDFSISESNQKYPFRVVLYYSNNFARLDWSPESNLLVTLVY
jgi:hypothetical protein